MKKVKRIFSLMLAVCLTLALAVPASALSVTVIPAEDESKEYGLVDSGVLENGTEYWVINLTPEEVVQHAMLRSYNWSGKVSVPIADITGTNGAKLGYDFTSYPDEYVVVEVGGLPSVMPSVNVGFYYTNGSNSDWEPNTGSYSMVVFKLEFPSNEGCIKVSTYEEYSRTTSFSFYTSADNPADSYIFV